MVKAVGNLLVIGPSAARRIADHVHAAIRSSELTSMHPDNAKVVNGDRRGHMVGAEDIVPSEWTMRSAMTGVAALPGLAVFDLSFHQEIKCERVFD